MSFARVFPPTLREIRILCSQSGTASAGIRQFIQSHYPLIKQHNPDIPVLIREASGTPARAFVRFERGVEKHVELDNLSAEEVKDRVTRLLQPRQSCSLNPNMDSLIVGLFKILRGYSSLSPLKLLKLPSDLSLAELHEFLLKLLLDPHLQQYPPSEDYRKSFWKWAIYCLEELSSGNETEEIDSRFYDYYLSLILPHDQPIGSSETPSQSYFTYYAWTPPAGDEATLVNLDHMTRFTLLESRTIVESGTTGLRTWKASFVLADYLLKNPELVQGKSVVELGSGVGFLGTVVAAIQQSNMLPGTKLCLTDANEQVLSRCSSNIKLPCNSSSSHPHIQCRPLNWLLSVTTTPSDLRLHFLVNECSPDVILGADIVFDPSLVPALAGMLKLCLSTTLSDHSKMALIALTARNCDTLALFIESVKDANLGIEELQLYFQHTSFVDPLSLDNDGHVKIFQITRV